MTASAAQTALTAPGGREPIPPTGGAPPGPPPEGAPFQSALEAEWARTATAEGRQQSHSESASRATSHDPPARKTLGVETGAPAAVSPAPAPASTAVASAASSADAPPAANVLAGAPGTPAARYARDSSDFSASTGLERSSASANATGASTLPGALPSIPSGGPASGAGRLAAGGEAAGLGSQFASGGVPTAAGDSGPASGAGSAASGATPMPAGATTPSTPGSPATEALTGALEGSNPAAPRGGLPGGWVGSDPAGARVGSDSGRSSDAKAPPLPTTPAAGAILGSAAHTEGMGAGGSWGWNSQGGGHQSTEQQGLRSAGGAGVHDKLWIPDPAQESTGADAGTSGAGAGGVGGLAEGAGSAQASVMAGADQSGIGQQGPLLDYGVGLQQAIESLHGTIQLAARQGLSQARIALEPEGLGEIRIHLTQTAQGLLARITAETPAAAQALAAGHSELRQSLSSLGLDLARLNIGRHGHTAAQGGDTALGSGGHGGTAGSGEAPSRGARSGQTAAAVAPTDPSPDSEAEEDTQPAPAPSRGTLVDVLA